MTKSKKEYFTRKIDAFNPLDYLKRGVDKDGREFTYLPALIRLLWYNAYVQENNKVMSLTSEIISENTTSVCYRATLTEYLRVGDSYYPIVISTGDGSALRADNGYEMAETKAKARCLGAAGFNIKDEADLFEDDPAHPADGPISVEGLNPINDASDKTKTTKKSKKAEGSYDEEEKPKANKVENNTEPVSKDSEKETTVPDLNSIIPKAVNVDGDSDRDDLERCLNSFFPYGRFKGEQVRQLIDDPKFINTIKEMSNQNYGTKIIEDGLTINHFLKVMNRYLFSPTTEDRKLLIEVLKS